MIGSFEHWLCWQVSSASQLPNEQQFFIVGKFDFLSGELGTPPIASEQSHHSPLLLAGITVRFHTDRYYRGQVSQRKCWCKFYNRLLGGENRQAVSHNKHLDGDLASKGGVPKL